MTTKQIPLSSVIFDETLYPRKKHDPALVQRYAECMDAIEAAGNFICVTADGRLVDGRHRHLAYLTIHRDKPDTNITACVYDVASDAEAFDLAAQLNSQSGWQMTEEDKRSAAVRMYSRAEGRKTQEDIAKLLSVGKQKISGWLSAIIDEERKAREATILDLWLSCHTQEDIAERVGETKQAVSQFLQKSQSEFCRNPDLLFSNFAPELYTVWNFAKATNEVKHFGNIPPEIVDNLLYYYTKPFDVVFDPFGGGGSTIDRCVARKRRYYVSDLSPIPARTDIRQHDITSGLPDDLPVPDLVFLDPPYWKQAEGKYSDRETDLANVTLDEFLDTIGGIARDVKRKWQKRSGKLALIIGPCKEDGKYIDLAMLCRERITKYLNPVTRIIVPYSTQVHGGAFVQMAKEKRELLYLYRDLMVFEAC